MRKFALWTIFAALVAVGTGVAVSEGHDKADCKVGSCTKVPSESSTCSKEKCSTNNSIKERGGQSNVGFTCRQGMGKGCHQAGAMCCKRGHAKGHGHGGQKKPGSEKEKDSNTQAGVAEAPASQSEPDGIDNHRGQKHAHGPGMGRAFRGGRGPGAMADMRPDMTMIHGMFNNRDKIKRTVKMLPDGAETITESNDEKIVVLIQDHVPNMDSRVLDNKPLPPMTFHPVFIGLIDSSDKYTLDYEETKKGIKTTYQSDDPYVVMLVQEHAKLVSRFIKNGMKEIHKPYDLPKFDKKSAAAKAKAITAKETLFKRLSARLTEVIHAQGPAAAIEVCSHEALQIAKTVGDEQGVRIGRTALKLRNPKNAAPDWTKSLLENPSDEARFVALANDVTGALLPIKLQAKCITCHGPKDKLAADVKAQLVKHYPSDTATGFKEGDLRGWFWVEVPTR